jgi:hypothetical protein
MILVKRIDGCACFDCAWSFISSGPSSGKLKYKLWGAGGDYVDV